MKLQIRKYMKIFACVIPLGLLLGILKSMFSIPDEIFWKIYCTFGGFVIVGCVLFNYCYHRHYANKMKEACKILEEKGPDAYIEFINGLLQKAKGKHLKAFFTVNLSVGYTDKKDYKKALELLESVSSSPMRGELKMVYKLNLCCNYYYDNQGEKARSIYEESLKIFSPFRETPIYGGNIAVIDMFMELENKNYDLAEGLLKSGKSKWNNPRLQDDFRYIEEILKENGKHPS